MLATFFGGFIIAFVQGWLLTLVMLCTIPPLVIAGGIIANVMSKMASRGQEAYGEAANVVEQTIGSIRTVSFFYLGGDKTCLLYENFVLWCLFFPLGCFFYW